MPLEFYTSATSVAAGGSIDFHVNNPGAGQVDVNVKLAIERYAPTGSVGYKVSFAAGDHTITTPGNAYEVGCNWPSAYKLNVPPSWPSGYYTVTLSNLAELTSFVLVVREKVPGSRSKVLVCVPFTTYQAYNGWGGKSLYRNEEPGRSRKVSFNRPYDGPDIHDLAVIQWMAAAGIAAEFCTSVDLHADPTLLAHYQLLISCGHDEYWSKEMRDNVEAFIAKGGNVAFFSGNVCWWQARFEDGNRTLVCYRDAIEDPLAGVDNSRVTVQWHAAPVNRPENSMTGVSYRKGAFRGETQSDPYLCNFPEHWVFEGTGLTLNATFAAGCVGYETDAAELVQDGPVMRTTCRDGTPPTFVVLAWADLSDWRRFGQGGHATMGIYRAVGTVFTAGTVQWGDGLGDPVIDRITQNVINRLSQKYPGDAWERVGHAINVTAMAACEGRLFAATKDNVLWWREPIGQNINWAQIGEANSVVAMTAPIEATRSRGVGLYAATADGVLWWREPVSGVHWTAIDHAHNVVAMGASNYTLFAATSGDRLLARPEDATTADWQDIGHANNVVAMTGLNGKLYCISDGQLWWRQPVASDVNWKAIGPAGNAVALAGVAGKLFAARADNSLWWRDALV
jgi:N,N-dimethylformamidase beta subunit-like, C-terminal